MDREAAYVTKYLLVGVINTVVGYTVIVAVHYLWDASVALANVVGYLAGMTVSFLLNRRFTFRASDGRLVRQIARFAVVIVSAFMVQLGVVRFVIDWLSIPLWIAQTAGIAVFTTITYIANRVWTFAERTAEVKR